MNTLDDIRARYVEYNAGSHQVDWYIDRGLALAADVGALLVMIDQQQAVIDAAEAVKDAIYERRVDRWGDEHLYMIIGSTHHGFSREDTSHFAVALFKIVDALAALKDAHS